MKNQKKKNQPNPTQKLKQGVHLAVVDSDAAEIHLSPKGLIVWRFVTSSPTIGVILEVILGALASIVIIFVTRLVGWFIEKVEVWILLKRASASYVFMKDTLSWIGDLSSIIFFSLATLDGVLTLLRRIFSHKVSKKEEDSSA